MKAYLWIIAIAALGCTHKGNAPGAQSTPVPATPPAAASAPAPATSGSPATAIDSKDRGGGDNVGLEFQKSYYTALQDLQKVPTDAVKALNFADLNAFFDTITVLTVDDPLQVTSNGIIQHSVAINDPQHLQILVNRARWQGLTDPHEREALALHEVFSIKALEATGQYTYSSLLLAELGVVTAPADIEVGATCAVESKCRTKDPLCVMVRPYDSNLFGYNLDQVWKAVEVCKARDGSEQTLTVTFPETVESFYGAIEDSKQACTGAAQELGV